MSAPGWAEELAVGVPPDLVAAIVTCAASGWGHPERLRAVLAQRLERNASTAVEAVIDDLAVPPRDDRRPPTAAAVEATAAALLDAGARVLAVGHPGYPSRLTQAWPELGAPAWLFVRAAGSLPGAPAVAVVGTRRPTVDGLQVARSLARFLAAHGVVVVSGMARGIDQAAHRGALEGGGRTVAVLGTGFGVDYPRHDERIREAVAASGGLVTEYVPGTPPCPPHFLWRNRIISGIVDIVVVVEGQARSGALHTARLAAAQGREVFAAPGSLLLPTSRGPLGLVRDGARLLTCFEDVLEAIGEVAGGAASPTPTVPRAVAGAHAVSEAAAAVGGLLGTAPASVTALAAASGLPVSRVLAAIAELSTAGSAQVTGRGVVAGG